MSRKALLLSGGGARGVISLGAILELFNRGYQYDALFGTSVGALNGVLVHQGQLDIAIKLWSTLKNSKIYHWAPWNALGPKASIFSSTPLANLIHSVYDQVLIATNPKPFYVSASITDPFGVDTRSLPLATPAMSELFVLASASAPIAFPTQCVPASSGTGFVRLSDGGAMRDFGIEAALALGYDDLTVITPTYPQAVPIRSIVDMLSFELNIQRSAQLSDEITAAKLLAKATKDTHLTIYQPNQPISLGLLDFDGAAKNYNQYVKMGAAMLSKPLESFHKAQTV